MSIPSCVPHPPASKITLLPAFCNFWQFLPLVSPSSQSCPPSSKTIYLILCVEVSCTFSNGDIYCPFRQFRIKSIYQALQHDAFVCWVYIANLQELGTVIFVWHSLYPLEQTKEFMEDHMVCILWNQKWSMVLGGQPTMTDDHNWFLWHSSL